MLHINVNHTINLSTKIHVFILFIVKLCGVLLKNIFEIYIT